MKHFKFQDIGPVTGKGSSKKVESGYDIIASGSDIWGQADEFHFAYTQIMGDFDLISRIESLHASDLYTKAGLMARESLQADSRNVMFLVFPDNSLRNNNNGGYEFQYRKEKGSESKAIYPADCVSVPPLYPVNFPNTWIRVRRLGDEFISYSSIDGYEWKEYTRYALNMGLQLYVGFAVTAHNNQVDTTCQLREIQFV